MQAVSIIVLVLFLVLLPAAMLLARRRRRRHAREELSAITRQHLELLQGGQLSETAVESAKARFRDLLERGEVEAVENSLRAGEQYVVQVRALAELGTEDAGRILERQLLRRLSDDRLEQTWYWIDLAGGLRSLNRSQCLPHLLRCAESAGEAPLGHLFAAETVCFLGFTGYLRQPETSLGRAALRVLLRALEGLRCGVPADRVSDGRLGEQVEALWDSRPEGVDPLAVCIYSEVLRFLRRSPHLSMTLAPEPAEREAFEWQASRLAALEPALEDHLQEAPGPLCELLAETPPSEHRDVLVALIELRAEAAKAVLPLLERPRYPHVELALELLSFSRDPRVEPKLRDWVLAAVPLVRRAQSRRKASAPRKPSVPEVPYAGILRALRGHPSPQTEALLCLASRDWDPTYRAAAVSSLGWWEPMQRSDVLLTLQTARRDPAPEVRQAARVALARLGERQSLLWFRQMLTGEDLHRVVETIQLVASEGITFLWPDLDRIADADESDAAPYAREALERMGEELGRR